MDQIRIAADSSCDLLTMDGVDFVSVPLTVRTAVEEFRDDAALNVDAGNREPRIRSRRDDRHQITVLRQRHLSVAFVWLPAGGHKNDLV